MTWYVSRWIYKWEMKAEIYAMLKVPVANDRDLGDKSCNTLGWYRYLIERPPDRIREKNEKIVSTKLLLFLGWHCCRLFVGSVAREYYFDMSYVELAYVTAPRRTLILCGAGCIGSKIFLEDTGGQLSLPCYIKNTPLPSYSVATSYKLTFHTQYSIK